MEKLTQILKDNGIAIICFLSIFVIAYILHLFGVVESFQQFVVVLASAAATYIIVCVTMNTQSKHQLEMQQELAKKQSELQKALMENDDSLPPPSDHPRSSYDTGCSVNHPVFYIWSSHSYSLA